MNLTVRLVRLSNQAATACTRHIKQISRYSIAHPDLCWICFDLRLRCHHTQTRWSELVRRIELWLEVQELNDEGRYAAVNIEPEPEVGLKCVHLVHSLFREGQEV